MDTTTGRKIIGAALVLTVLVFSGCNRLQSGSESIESLINLSALSDETRPLVSSTTPANGAADIAFPSMVTVLFSERMDPATVNGTTFTLYIGATPVAGDVSLVNRTATFAIGQPVTAFTTYTATVTTGCADMAGNPLGADYSWSFTTGASPDVTAPWVTGTSPADLEVNVAVDSSIQVSFNEAVDPATVSDTTFIIEEAGLPIAGTTVTPSGDSVTIDPPADLAPSTTYTVTVTTGVTDLSGNALTMDYIFTFTTGTGADVTPPSVDFIDPANGATGVSLTGPISVSFDEDMDTGTISTASFRLSIGPLPVTGTVAQVGMGPDYAFMPDLPLLPGVTYTATVTTGVTDLAGNPLAADYAWSFTTGLAPANLAQGLSFNDTDRGEDFIGGTATIIRAADESDIGSYVVCWGSDAATKLAMPAIIELAKTGSDIPFIITDGTAVPAGATHLLVYSKNLFGESAAPAALDFDDMVCRMIEVNTLDNTGSSPSNFAEYNGQLYFSAWNGSTHFTELWSLDAAESLNMAASINASGHSYPMGLTVYDGLLYFAATGDAGIGRELWSYDDSPVALTLVQDINPGAGNSDPKFLTVFDGYLYFQASDGIEGFELYEYDGSALAHWDLNPGGANSYPAYMTRYGSYLYFQANNGALGEELWMLDAGGGTINNITDQNPGINSFSPASLYVFNGMLYLQGTDGSSGIEPWSYDGATTALIADIAPGGLHSSPYGFFGYDNKLYFGADDNTNGYQLWVYDPPAAPAMVQVNASGNAYPKSFVTYNGDLYFSADNGVNGQELWVYDGITPITVGSNMRMACEINPGGPAYVDNLFVYNGRLYFSANDGVNGPELWVYYLK